MKWLLKHFTLKNPLNTPMQHGTTRLQSKLHQVPCGFISTHRTSIQYQFRLHLKQISQKKKENRKWKFGGLRCVNVKIVDFLSCGLCVWKVIYTNDENNDIWLSSRRVIFSEPLLGWFDRQLPFSKILNFFILHCVSDGSPEKHNFFHNELGKESQLKDIGKELKSENTVLFQNLTDIWANTSTPSSR